MIFALLSNTPCLVFENKSYKVRGVYNWIKDVNYIKLCNSEKMEEQIAELLNEKDTQYDNRKLLKNYEELIKLIKRKKINKTL